MRGRKNMDRTNELGSDGYVSLHTRSRVERSTGAETESKPSVSDRAASDRELIQYLLDYADTIHRGDENSDFHFIAFAITEIAKRETNLADQLLQAIQTKATKDPEFREELIGYFAPVVEDGLGKDFQECLRILRRKKTAYALGRKFADRVRHAGESGYRRFLFGLSGYLDRVGVAPEKRTRILERVGFLAASLGLGILGATGSAHAAGGAVASPKASALVPAVKLAIAVPLACLAIIGALKLGACDACSKRSESTQAVPNISTEPHKEIASRSSKAAISLECDHAVSAPEKKSCLINAGDSKRNDLTEAVSLYQKALDVPYDATYSAERSVDNGYWNSRWKQRLSGRALFLAQNFVALAGSSSVLALHRSDKEAAREWHRATEILEGSNVVDPAYTDSEEYIENFLDERAGIKTQKKHPSVFPQYQYSFRNGMRAERELQADDRLQAFLDAKAATQLDNANPIWKLTFPSNSRYWRGVLPSQPEFEKSVRVAMTNALTGLRDAGLAY